MPVCNWHLVSLGKQTCGVLPTNSGVDLSFAKSIIDLKVQRMLCDCVKLNNSNSVLLIVNKYNHHLYTSSVVKHIFEFFSSKYNLL
jgi:hypothetical protein